MSLGLPGAKESLCKNPVRVRHMPGRRAAAITLYGDGKDLPVGPHGCKGKLFVPGFCGQCRDIM